jgi:hypothetical protein
MPFRKLEFVLVRILVPVFEAENAFYPLLLVDDFYNR